MIEAKITFHGSQTNAAVQQAIATAAVLVASFQIGPRNPTDGLQTVVAEALATGQPVIAAQLTGIPEVLRDGETGFFFEIEDAGQKMDALQIVYRAPDHAQRLAVQGRALVYQKYEQRVNSGKPLDLIVAHSVLNPHGSTP